MKKTRMQKATKGNLKKTILNALAKAAKKCQELTGVHVRNSPEYVLNMYIVNEVCTNFHKVGFRLEMKFSELFRIFKVEPKFLGDINKGAKFDIVLTSRKNARPRHVIEVKRSIKKKQMVKESKRIRFVAESEHGSKRLETGFIACVTSEKKKGKSVENIIADRVKHIKNSVGEGFTVSEMHKKYDFGELGLPTNEGLLLVVFEIKKI